MSARSVIPSSVFNSAIRVVIQSDNNFVLGEGELLAVAEEKLIREIPSAVNRVIVGKTQVKNDKYLNGIIQGFPNSLSVDERRTAEKFVRSLDALSRSEFDLEYVDLAPLAINTREYPPYKKQLRRHPVAYLQFIDDEVEKMVANNIVEPTSSPWASNVVLVKKSNTELGFCVELRSCTFRIFGVKDFISEVVSVF